MGMPAPTSSATAVSIKLNTGAGSALFPLDSGGNQYSIPVNSVPNVQVVLTGQTIGGIPGPAVAVNLSATDSTCDYFYTTLDDGSAKRMVSKIQSLVAQGSNALTQLVDTATPVITGALTFAANTITATGTTLDGAAFFQFADGTQIPVNTAASSGTSVVSEPTTYNPGSVPSVSLLDINLNVIATYP